MTNDEIALQIMLKLIEGKADNINNSFRSEPNQSGVDPEKVAEFYCKLFNSLEKND